MRERIVVVDGTLPESQIEREIWKVVKKTLDVKAPAASKKTAPKPKRPTKKASS